MKRNEPQRAAEVAEKSGSHRNLWEIGLEWGLRVAVQGGNPKVCAGFVQLSQLMKKIQISKFSL
jgi:hypothetical protein